jgi:hypothetical protein
MNRKVLMSASLLMILPVITTTFAYATPWVEKNNDKFQTFYSAGTFNGFVAFGSADRTYIPSFDKVEKLMLTWSESFTSFEIEVDGKTYTTPTDFDVSGTSEHIYWDPVFRPGDITKTQPPAGSRASHTTGEYTFEFKPASGLEGSFSIRTIVNEGNHRTTSISGTGDFRNVQIQATVSQSQALPFVTIANNGLVIGWPE